MKKLSISKLFLALVGCVYLFVSLIMGIITDASPSFWTGFGFLTFAVVLAVVVLLCFGSENTTIKDVFFNAPVYYIGTVYFVVSGVISVLHMIAGLLTLKWLFVAQLITFALFAVYFILSLVGKTNAENVIEKVAEKNSFIREITSKLNTAAGICTDRETKLKIEALAEEFQYSKPSAGAELDNIENKIRQSAAILDYQVGKSDFEGVAETVAVMSKDLVKRNEIAKSIK